jgi:hypothetical protein
MKKINFLIVMALATQGASLAGKDTPRDFGAEVIDGDVFFNATDNSEDYHGLNESGKKRINLLNRARKAAVEQKDEQESDTLSTQDSTTDTTSNIKENISELASQAMALADTSAIKDMPALNVNHKGVLSALWDKPIVRAVVLAALVVGSDCWLNDSGISKSTQDILKKYVASIAPATKAILQKVWESGMFAQKEASRYKDLAQKEANIYLANTIGEEEWEYAKHLYGLFKSACIGYNTIKTAYNLPAAIRSGYTTIANLPTKMINAYRWSTGAQN